MTRPLRLDYRGARHHVMNRGARRAPVFVDDATRLLFLDLLAEASDRFGAVVHGYALMGNHYHLLIEVPRGNLSQIMQFLGSEFARRLNALHPGWDGPVFRGRFRNRLVEDEGYWMHLLAYVHLNPLEHGGGVPVDALRWTSHRAYVGLAPRPAWLAVDEHLDLFGGVEAYRAYLDDVVAGREPGPDGFDAAELWTPAATAGLPAPVPEPPSVHAALAEVCDVTGVHLPALRRARQGPRGNRARWVAAWWLERAAGVSHRQIAELLATSPDLVGRWVRALRVPADRQVAGWMAELEQGRASLWGAAK